MHELHHIIFGCTMGSVVLIAKVHSCVFVAKRLQTDCGCGVALTPLVIGKDHGQLLFESAQHSFPFLN